MVELLSPVGDFDCLRAAVQNGADAVYFGGGLFSARAFASNFGDEALESAICYAKLRGVKTNLTLNTLIKDSEFEDAFNLAKTAYEFGVDAIIVQDLGLASKLIECFPDIVIHGSTQMTIHNLEGVKRLEDLGYKRVVLSRELPVSEIEYICKNSNAEIEVFVHGALCISYSGQCLFSSMIGGRSGNRGKCAQPCRLPYSLVEQSGNLESSVDSGYLLSPRDVCGLEFLPQLIDAGVTSFKIEGRMKTPEYVATVTRIYRKYIDLAISGNDYVIDEQDKKDLMQVFNRGNFSNGHLSDTSNKNLVYKEKQNNMGLYLGKIVKYNQNKGLVTCILNEKLKIGDSVSFENENTKYTVSELMENDKNIKVGIKNQKATFGRMKGNINENDKVFKISSKELSTSALESFSKDFKKVNLNCDLEIKKDTKIKVLVSCPTFNLSSSFEFDYIPLIAENKPIDFEKIHNQFSKTNDTPFVFENLDIKLDDNLFIPVSVLNELRRITISNIENIILSSFKRDVEINFSDINIADKENTITTTKKISVLLNNLNLDYNYLELENVDRLYIPLKYFSNIKYYSLLDELSNKFDTYIYLPTVVRKNYVEVFKNIVQNAIKDFKINGFVISNLSQIEILNSLNIKKEFIGNYTLNIYNSFSEEALSSLGFSTLTISPELDKQTIKNISNNKFDNELIVYGNTPVMTSNYCLLGNANKCYKDCDKKCMNNKQYYLKDRLNLKFRIIPDNAQTITTIYNTKTTSISDSDFNNNYSRIDILDETIDEVNKIISTVKNHKRLEGADFTNGNLNREI